MIKNFTRAKSNVWWRIAPLLLVGVAFGLRVYLLPTVPFGWHPDEATKGLLAGDVLAGRFFPAFFSAFTGREALYVYLEALMFVMVGYGILAGRLLSAFIGVLTVACTYRIGRVMFNRRVALWSMALFTVSLWHLIASRNGYRGLIQSLVQAPVLWLLWQAHCDDAGHARRTRYLLAAGFFLGLSLYTYTAARLFPFLILLILALMFVTNRRLWMGQWRALLLMAGVAFLVSLPLLIHFYRHPIDFYGRAAQISVFSPDWSGGHPFARLWQSVRDTAVMFTQRGDGNFRFNLPERAVFGVVDGAFFYAGCLLCVWAAIRSRAERRLPYVTLLLWQLVMLLPMTLSAEGLPYYQRAIGVLPGLYFLPALALDALTVGVQRLGRHAQWVRIACALLSVVLWGGLAIRTTRDYFVTWHGSTRNDDDRRVAMVYVADYLRDHVLPGELYLSTEYPEHPTLAFLASTRYDNIRWFDARQSLPLPPPGVEATYILLEENPPQPDLLNRVPALQWRETQYDRFDRPVFTVYSWKDGLLPMPTYQSPATWSWEVTFEPGDPHGLRHTIALPINFGDVLEFIGYEGNAEQVRPGDLLAITLYWRLLQRPERHYSMFVHVLNPAGQVVAEYDANRYPTSYWLPDGGELLLSYFPMWLPPDLPPDDYQIEFGVYHQPTWERLPVYQDGEMVADRILLPVLTLP